MLQDLLKSQEPSGALPIEQLLSWDLLVAIAGGKLRFLQLTVQLLATQKGNETDICQYH